jgi:hypothetical protein
MREAIKLSAFVLLGVGTLGLIINELIFDWGRAATLTLAAVNIVGFAILAYMWRSHS